MTASWPSSVPKQLEHLSRIVDAKVANRQAREMHANLPCANAKLQHKILGLQPGTGHDLRCHGSAN